MKKRKYRSRKEILTGLEVLEYRRIGMGDKREAYNWCNSCNYLRRLYGTEIHIFHEEETGDIYAFRRK